MFKDEAKIAINLSHSNIVSLHEFGMERQQFFIVMDFVEGRNLRQILNKMKKSGVSFSIEQVLYVIREVAAGLDHAHRCLDANTGKPLNIIHRDMSPQNVMVSFEGEVKIVDFGIAKAETQIETTRAGTLKGKFGYMSPEQAEGQMVDLRTDVFSLGIVLWELLANDRLFVANNEMNTLRKIRDCQIPSLRKINPNIPPELERIVSKALAKDKNLRYQTAAAFHRELSRFLNRQYPDFSPQDFAVFIKTLFAGEILENRKKMVEYAKIEMRAPQLPQPVASNTASAPDKTVVTSTFTENTGPSQIGKHPSKIEPEMSVSPDALSDLSFEALAESSISGANQNSGAQLPAHPRAVSKTAPSPRRMDLSYTGTVPPNPSGTRSISQPIHSSRSSGALFNSLSLALVLGGFLALAAGAGYFYTNPKEGIGRLQKYGLFSKPKPLQVQATENASTDPNPMGLIYVKSSPPGAAIFVDGQPARETTPAELRLPDGKVATISVHLDGYEEYHEQVAFAVNQPRTLGIALRPANGGTLIVSPQGNGRITIDGKEIPAGQPIAVFANRELTVRIDDPATQSFAEEKVFLKPGESRTVILTPMPPSRMRQAPSQPLLEGPADGSAE
jgi:serine/threonine-protein kinase